MRRLLMGLAVITAVATACGPSTDAAGDAGRLDVVAAFYPLAEAAERVGGNRASVTNLTPTGAEPHDLELTTADVDRVLDADVVLYIGDGFQPAIELTVNRRAGASMDVLVTPGDDPHVWLDPTRMIALVTQVRDAFSEVDPEGAPGYAARATDYVADLVALDEAFRAGLADCRLDTFVTAHDAFGHLAERYGLTQEAIAGLSPESEPNPARLAELADLVRRLGIETVFYETLGPAAVAEALAREAGVEAAALNALEGLSDEEIASGATYLSVMQHNLTLLRSALRCP